MPSHIRAGSALIWAPAYVSSSGVHRLTYQTLRLASQLDPLLGARAVANIYGKQVSKSVQSEHILNV